MFSVGVAVVPRYAPLYQPSLLRGGLLPAWFGFVCLCGAKAWRNPGSGAGPSNGRGIIRG